VHVTAERERPGERAQDVEDLGQVRHRVAVLHLAADLDQARGRPVIHVSVEGVDGRRERDVVERDDWSRRRKCCNVGAKPGELRRVDVPVVPEVVDVDRIQTDEVDTAESK
jgi:hypothetical protein